MGGGCGVGSCDAKSKQLRHCHCHQDVEWHVAAPVSLPRGHLAAGTAICLTGRASGDGLVTTPVLLPAGAAASFFVTTLLQLLLILLL